MKIGKLDFGERPLFLAPMEDVTDIGFRMLCKRYGAAMVYTEFVSADAIIRSIKSTLIRCQSTTPNDPLEFKFTAEMWSQWLRLRASLNV